MNGVQRLAKVFMLDNERDIRLGSALGASDHADARTSQRTEQLPGDTRGTFHVLAYNSDGSQILLRYGIVHITCARSKANSSFNTCTAKSASALRTAKVVLFSELACDTINTLMPFLASVLKIR